jgi:16S rRNA (uracil1498-N3)-methyltransferase
MRRIHLTSTPAVGETVTLPAAQAHYVSRVLRLRVGDTLVIFDGSGYESHLTLTAVSGHHVQGQVMRSATRRTSAPEVHIILGQGLPKSSKMDLIVEKCSELGLTTLVPLYTARTVVRDAPDRVATKLARWQRIAEAAARQSGRSLLLDIHPPQSLTALYEHYGAIPGKLMCWENERQLGLRQAVDTLCSGDASVVLVGPEGGWTPQEVDAARAHGFTTISLGPHTLRTETAAITITSLIRYSLGAFDPSNTQADKL